MSIKKKTKANQHAFIILSMSPRGNSSCLTLIRNMKLLWGAERCCMFFQEETADSGGTRAIQERFTCFSAAWYVSSW